MKKISLILIGNYLVFIKGLFLLFLISWTSFLKAENEERFALLSLGVGAYNIVRNQRTVQYQVEYKWKNSIHHIQPFISSFITNHGSFYVCGGGCLDVIFFKKLIITPSFGAGLYFKGKGKDLGFPLEFRSSMALSYQFENRNRIGAQFYHISNASLGHRNPGEESLIIFFSFPP